VARRIALSLVLSFVGVAPASARTDARPSATCATVQGCRSEIARLNAAVNWQRSARRLLARQLRRIHQPLVIEAAQLAARALHVDAGQMIRVSACETGGTFSPYSRNASSGALGAWQFLPSTWAHTPFARWSPTNPFAAALATAEIVQHEGWRQWSCKP
jgi:hypothetical protein